MNARLWRVAALTLAAAHALVLAWLFARRLGFPYDLEWLEGGTLCHALRLVEGRPIYAAPSIDFVSFPYTPLYPALLALGARVLPLGYALGRAVSLLSFAGALALGWRFCVKEGAAPAVATAAMAIPLAAFAPTGAWLDLVRVDSLWLLLVVAAMTLGFRARRSHAGAAAAAVLLVLAFFTKQTAAPFMLALFATLAVSSRRTALTFALTLALVGAPALLWADRASGGWFRFYVAGIHKAHPFWWTPTLVTPGRLLLILFPSVLLVPLALHRRRTPATRYALFLLVVGWLVSALARGTDGAFTNAFIPGVFMSALAVGVAGGALLARRDGERLVFGLTGATLALAPGALILLLGWVRPSSWPHGTPMTGYQPWRYLPTAADRAAGDALVGILAGVDGEVMVPSHPFYAHLAGKRTYVGEMGLLDLRGTGTQVPLDARFSALVLDEPTAIDWTALTRALPRRIALDGPTVRVGGPRRVAWLYLR